MLTKTPCAYLKLLKGINSYKSPLSWVVKEKAQWK
jgi:hypothetical protein